MELDGIDQSERSGAARVSAEPYRQRTASERLAIVKESYSASRSVAATARLHGITDKRLFKWRKAFSEGRLGGGQPSAFVQAVVVEDTSEPAASGVSGRMEIVSANGRRVVVGSDFDASALSRLLDVVEARR